jgi:hypothetical protein
MYFIFLSASDSFCMLYRLTVNVIYNPWRDNQIHPTLSFECILSVTFFNFSPELSAWIIVCICAERTLSIYFPLKFNTKGAGRRAKFAFISLLILLAGVNLCDATLRCTDFYSNTGYTITHISDVYVLCVFPLSLITICNVITIVVLWKRKSPVVSSSRRHLTKFTRLSIVTGMFHCVCVLPYMIVSLSETDYIDLDLGFESYSIFVHVSTLFLYLNNTFNFLLYSLASKDFQQDLKQLLCSCRNCE